MNAMRGIFTKKPYNPGSLLIRAANPVTFYRIAPASHVIAVDGHTGYGLEANAFHGVRRLPLEELLDKQTIVEDTEYNVPDAEAGLIWMRETAARNAKYDFKGALGLGLAPTRQWQQDTDWFCFEYFANGLTKAGRNIFHDNAHVTAYMLLSVAR